MTRDEAINAAFEHVRKVMGDNLIFRIMIAGEKTEIVAYEKHFPFEPPRRIPSIGVTVRDIDTMWVGYFSGDTAGERIKIVDRMENASHSWMSSNWIELVEATP